MTTLVEGDRFKDVMAAVGAPVTIVTAFDGDVPHGTTVTAFSSLSLDPPLADIALSENSALLPKIIRSGRFGVNVLARPQEELARRFARRDVDRFAGADWYADDGLPRLSGCTGWLACDVRQTVESGDHVLIIGAVTAAGRSARTDPLIYMNRTFVTLSSDSATTPASTRTVS
ncbi:hypothetical protein A6A06_22140 [Streptomyces sp. CB02923]|uniref:flavin reductase family protein n=1 Tax=Streptomyces sp. CB02923 TaxID=1718985 RepID=UPI00093A543F|nr:flavin reductase family protein [Streptomyces sp. CB02923]OKI00362.1 hypothetical protein A6A06_22140 [Streptomyces sp. CB02923]